MRYIVLLASVATVAIVVTRADISVPLGPVVVAVAAVAVVAVFRRRRRRRIRDWRDAEAAAARWLRRAGCRQVEMTSAGADGGIDVITAEWAVQVKHTNKRVGRPAVQQLVGAALAIGRAPVLFSTSGFSKPGLDYADDHDVALLEMDLTGNAIRLNRTADRLGSRARRLLRR